MTTLRLKEDRVSITSKLLKKDKINWSNLAANPNAIDLIKKQINIDPYEIDWNKLSSNPAIFKAV